MSAVVKLQIATELQKMKAEVATYAELWSQAQKRNGLPKKQLQII